MLRVALIPERDQGVDRVVAPVELDDDQHPAVSTRFRGPRVRARKVGTVGLRATIAAPFRVVFRRSRRVSIAVLSWV